jgi:hypothetical protein
MLPTPPDSDREDAVALEFRLSVRPSFDDDAPNQNENFQVSPPLHRPEPRFARGFIFWAVPTVDCRHEEITYSPSTTVRHRTDQSGGFVIRKNRLWVVVQSYSDNHVVLPIYTFGGKGLQGPMQVAKQEFISIKMPDAILFENQRPELQPLITEAQFSVVLRPRSEIWITRPACFGF